MKRILSILLCIISLWSFAQMDTEHWLAPFAKSSSVYTSSEAQYLYLSTDTTTPFTVSIYNNNAIIDQVSISKGNPGVVYIDEALMTAIADSEKSVVGKKGLHLVADHKFFAHYRFVMTSQAEIVTSKGKAGLGTEFFVYTPENTSRTRGDNDIANSTVGIIATENNTTITIDNFQNSGRFTNGDTFTTSTTLSITLNRGESYVLECLGSSSLQGISGARITSDKAISISNGSYYNVALNGSNVDVFMDQAIPIERLGNQYIAVKGNGGLIAEMERVAVMATEDNTNIYINGNTSPINIAKKGETYIIESAYYHQASTSSDAYSIFIDSDQKIYTYQLLTGTNDGGGQYSYASGGMNILPPLLCLLPNSINEFAYVNEIGGNTFNTRMNIITEKGATVKINGTTLGSSYGPFAVLGNSDWEFYVYPNISGNITIESTKAVTAGIAAGNQAVGYGGYFAGFNSNPVIAKGGTCEDGTITLEVDDSYDDYQWYISSTENGTYTEYTGEGANTYKITPNSVGYYYVIIKKNSTSCNDEYQSPIFKVDSCPVYSSISLEIGECGTTITPAFSSSTQQVNPTSVTITTPPSNGTAIIDSSGNIVYTPSSNTVTTDSFVYYIEGIHSDFPDKEYITVNLSIKSINRSNAEITACADADGMGIYDLSSVSVSTDTNVTISYFESLEDATLNTNAISNFNAYYTVPKVVYARIEDTFSCYAIAEITLKTIEAPTITAATVSHSTLTITASGGTPPYTYSWSGLCGTQCDDSSVFVSTNTFSNIPLGGGTAYVADANGCTIVSKEFINLNLINTITPNGDGVNEILDYSQLSIKSDVKIQVFDRYGKLIFTNREGQLTWDGKSNGRVVSTGTYWYLLSWIEPDTKEAKQYQSWIVVKNK